MNFFLFVLLASFWGGSFVAIKTSIENLPPIFAASLRVLTALFFISIAFKVLRISTKLPDREKRLCYALGFFSISLPFGLLFWGEQYVSAGIAGVINGTVPIWTFISAYYIFKTNISSLTSKLIGVLVSFAGILLMFAPGLQLGVSENEVWGIISIFGMAISYGIGANLAKFVMAKGKVSPKIAVYHQHISAAWTLVIVAFIFEGSEILSLQSIPFSAVGSTLYLGVFSTSIAYFILFYLLEQWGPVKAMTVTYLIPIMAISFDFLIHGNKLVPVQFVGVGVILVGLLIVQSSSLFSKQSKSEPVVAPSKL